MHEELSERLGATARKARLARRLTQADVAERVGCSTEFYARIERGKTLPSVPTLAAIARALTVSADALLGLNEPATLRIAEAAPQDPPELRRAIRRLRAASPRVTNLVNLLLVELGAARR